MNTVEMSVNDIEIIVHIIVVLLMMQLDQFYHYLLALVRALFMIVLNHNK